MLVLSSPDEVGPEVKQIVAEVEVKQQVWPQRRGINQIKETGTPGRGGRFHFESGYFFCYGMLDGRSD